MSFIASIIAVFASVGVQTARLDALYNDDLVVTNVTESGGVDTNAVVAISATQITNDVASWALKPNPAPVTDLTPAINYTTAVSNKLEASKQNVIADLETIRSGAALGATAVQTETDPTVSAWAKASQKPSYTYDEIGGTFPGWIKPDQVGLSSYEFWIGQDTSKPFPSKWISAIKFFHYDRGILKVGQAPSYREGRWGIYTELGESDDDKRYIATVWKNPDDGSETKYVLKMPKESGIIETREHAATNYLGLSSTNSFASGILTQSGRDCGAKIAALSNNVTKVLTISTNGVAAARYNGTAAVSLDITAGGGGVDPEQVKTIISEVFPSNRVFGVSGGLLTAYDVSADGARTNEIWREARGYALTNGVNEISGGAFVGVVNPAIDGTITTITIGDETMAAAGVSVDLPSAWDAEARDFAVYVFNSSSTAAPLRLPTNATIYGYYSNATNALKANAATALYFTEISRNTFLLGRAELTKVQEAAE